MVVVVVVAMRTEGLRRGPRARARPPRRWRHQRRPVGALNGGVGADLNEDSGDNSGLKVVLGRPLNRSDGGALAQPVLPPVLPPLLVSLLLMVVLLLVLLLLLSAVSPRAY